MINAAPRGLAQCPWCTHRHLASFFYLPIQERETCTGLPSSGRTSRSTSDFRTHVELEKGVPGDGGGDWAQVNQPGRRKPGLTFQLICSPLKHRDLKTHETGSKRNQLMFLCCSSPHFPPPVYNRHQTASVKQPSLLCSHLSLKKTLQIPAFTRTLSPGKLNQHTRERQRKAILHI